MIMKTTTNTGKIQKLRSNVREIVEAFKPKFFSENFIYDLPNVRAAPMRLSLLRQCVKVPKRTKTAKKIFKIYDNPCIEVKTPIVRR